ncbi:hypothetical protein L226DRAFT_616644 [Lentinus tigrinus ALCF2SS1-7]|uniref:Uncharacterized protein n=1 Tax=Lentinus tigrinus ALCF2SS1-6 TaxID=1328759 RepID=A0A5C2RW29_9APHY|nr:hypothetical protein L227DRAFT_332600 [Lentinus tigrinus ALCF2SS1-6]RPD69713.1 hypothetical protein L226DRAFT_616644 [Lentinus tigrinus ALCF2SS1-7]
MTATSIARPPVLPPTTSWSLFSWEPFVATTATTSAVPESGSRKRVREQDGLDAPDPESKRVRVGLDGPYDACTTSYFDFDRFTEDTTYCQTTDSNAISTFDGSYGVSDACHPDDNRSPSVSTSAATSTDSSCSWTWTSVQDVELPTLQRDDNAGGGCSWDETDPSQLESNFPWISCIPTSVTPAPTPDSGLCDAAPPPPSTGSRRLSWKERKAGPSPLRQSHTMYDLSTEISGELQGREHTAPVPLDDSRRGFAHRFLKQRADLRRSCTTNEYDGVFRCTLADEDPRPLLLGTPPKAREDRQPLTVPTARQCYQYNLDQTTAQVTGLAKLSADAFCGYGATLARHVSSNATRPFTDRISLERCPQLEIELLDQPGFPVLVQADQRAVAVWTSHAEVVRILKEMALTELTTGPVVEMISCNPLDLSCLTADEVSQF